MGTTTATTTYDCEKCGQSYSSFATYTRQDPCYTASKAKRHELLDGETGFDQPVTVSSGPVTGSAGYGIDAAAEMRKADAPARTTSNQYGTFRNHAASEKQVAFAKRLLAERPSYDFTTSVDSLDKRQISRLIDDLLGMPAEIVSQTNLASEKQVTLLKKLWAERLTTSFAGDGTGFEKLSKKDASMLIDALFGAPKLKKKKAAKSSVIDEDGMYYLDTDDGIVIYKVQIAHHGSGNLYAKRLHVDDHDETFTEWVYEGRKPLHKPLQKLSLEKAKEFGHLYGVCCSCGATLTDEASIEAGIGPVCARKF